jgi:hypothetical protein
MMEDIFIIPAAVTDDNSDVKDFVCRNEHPLPTQTGDEAVCMK